MSIIYKGATQVFRGPLFEYRAGQGDTTGQIYEFPTKELAEAFYQQQRGGQNDVRFNSADGPPYRVEVSVPALDPNAPDDSFEDIWEIDEFDQTKSIYESPAFYNLTPAFKSMLRDFDDEGYQFVFEELTANNAPTSAFDLLDLISNDQKEYKAPSAILRWTRILSRNNAAVVFAAQNTTRIFSLPTMLSLPGIPQPAALLVEACHNQMPQPFSSHATGWLKSKPSLMTRGTGKSELRQMWTLENWSTTLYGNPV